jgi:hypothetical protein
MNPTITISTHGQEETLTLHEAIMLRNWLHDNPSYSGDYWYAFPDNKLWFIKNKDAKPMEADLTSEINEHQSPVAASLNRLPDNHESKK